MGYKVFVDFEMIPIPKKYKEERKICKMEIIQIGAVMLDEADKEVSEFKRNVAPAYIDYMPTNLIDLLGLSYEDLAWRCRFRTGIEDFVEWIYSITDDFKVYAWSGSDLSQLNREIELKNMTVSEKLSQVIENWIDLQKEFDEIIGAQNATGLKKAIEMCGIEFEGKEHDSLIDSRNTAQVYRESRDRDALLRQIHLTEKYTGNENHFTCTLGDMFDFSQFKKAANE